MTNIRACRDDDRSTILAIINAAAETYRGVIPADRWHEPYMSRDELDREIARLKDKVAVLAFSRPDERVDYWLRMSRDPKAYAHKLYGALRELDEAGCEAILIEAPPEAPEWAAVLDRLRAYPARQVEIDGCTYREGLQAVRIAGGVAGNVVPDECVVTVNFRFAPDRAAEAAEHHVREVFDGFDVVVTDHAPGALPGLRAPAAQAFVAATGAGAIPSPPKPKRSSRTRTTKRSRRPRAARP